MIRVSSRRAAAAARIVTALVALATLVAGCARRESRREPDTAGQGPAAADSLLAAIASQLAPWLPMWREAIPGFTLDSLRLAAAAPFHPELDQPLHEAFFDLPRRRWIFQRWSPDSAFVVDPNVYLDLDDDGRLVVEPDNAVALIDRREGRWERLMGCGTPCRYFDALWVAQRIFAVAVWYESDAEPGRWAPALHVFDLSGRRCWRYDGPEGGAERVDAFQRALERRLAAHPVAAIP
jgi:hypothetical protein